MLGKLKYHKALENYRVGSMYVIPIDEVDYNISENIIYAIKNEYVLTASGGASRKPCYVLKRLLCEGSYGKLSDAMNGLLKSYFISVKSQYFNEVNLELYYNNVVYQKAIDDVLILADSREFSGYTLGVRVAGRKLFFVEARVL